MNQLTKDAFEMLNSVGQGINNNIFDTASKISDAVTISASNLNPNECLTRMVITSPYRMVTRGLYSVNSAKLF